MVNEKDTIRQMTPIFDYILISELISLNTRPSLFIYPLLARQDVMLNFTNSISMNPVTLSWLSHFPNIRYIVPTWALTHWNIKVNEKSTYITYSLQDLGKLLKYPYVVIIEYKAKKRFYALYQYYWSIQYVTDYIFRSTTRFSIYCLTKPATRRTI